MPFRHQHGPGIPGLAKHAHYEARFRKVFRSEEHTSESSHYQPSRMPSSAYQGNVVFEGSVYELLSGKNEYARQFVSAAIDGPMNIASK